MTGLAYQVHCTACPHLESPDQDGLVLVCKLTGQRVFIDDLPLTVMSRCPREVNADGTFY